MWSAPRFPHLLALRGSTLSDDEIERLCASVRQGGLAACSGNFTGLFRSISARFCSFQRMAGRCSACATPNASRSGRPAISESSKQRSPAARPVDGSRTMRSCGASSAAKSTGLGVTHGGGELAAISVPRRHHWNFEIGQRWVAGHGCQGRRAHAVDGAAQHAAKALRYRLITNFCPYGRSAWPGCPESFPRSRMIGSSLIGMFFIRRSAKLRE